MLARDGTLTLYRGGENSWTNIIQLKVTKFEVLVNNCITFIDHTGDKRIVGNMPYDFTEDKTQSIPVPSKYHNPMERGDMW